MNLAELEELVQQGESETLEFKRTTGQLNAAMKTVCAMINGIGGIVVFGVDDKGVIHGQDVTTRTHEGIANELRKISPSTSVESGAIALENGKEAIVLGVPGGGGPCLYDGRAYQRIGPTTGMMDQEQYGQRILERRHHTSRWENEPVRPDFGIADLDHDEIQRTVDTAVRIGRLEPPRDREPEAILRGLGLILDDQLLNAAVALFGNSQRLRPFYPQLEVRLARFRGVNRLADFIDNRQYWGNAFESLRRAEQFLRDHVPIAGRVVAGKIEREDRPRYPPRATREALANAICHRDYTIGGGAVAVAMYDDHLEIVNPGSLRFGLTPEKLTREHESRPWNPTIANVFYLTGVIERWGTGTLNMLDWCAENHSPPPAWSERAGSVVVSFLPAEAFPDDSAPEAESRAEPVDVRVLRALAAGPLSRLEIAVRLGQKRVSGQVHSVVRELLDQGAIEYTIPDSPRSPQQQYRITDLGTRLLAEQPVE